MTVLETAQGAGIAIPTLCHHEKLEPFGGCRLCIVEVEERGWTKLVVSCVYPVEKNLIVRTRSEKVDRIRKMILELLMAHAPDAFLSNRGAAGGFRFNQSAFSPTFFSFRFRGIRD
jgi:bidirectional [NiFe] hydrogenase diaphorase subunit